MILMSKALLDRPPSNCFGRRRSLHEILAFISVLLLTGLGWPAQAPSAIRNSAGFRLLVVEENSDPALRLVLPGRAESDRSIEVLFPEHITARRRGRDSVEQLYLFRPGPSGERPAWRRVGQSLEYERELPGTVHFRARATLEADGVRFRYEYHNRSQVTFDMIYAATDPRLTGIFHDQRLERTYVHHSYGFDLLASETPSRLTMPLNSWLPARYLASFTWPVPAARSERTTDGIAHYYKSRAVDQPLIATISTDGSWIVASFTRETGNVWSNPQLTCQHVDPQSSLVPGQLAVLEVKILVVQGSLQDVLTSVVQERRASR